ncbi:MAG: RIP metalloprotease RseP [Paracoccus sp. (in: a-proteobacteria)]|nr:RIP metalloprotease RseP [Paracoccus sp. (in: a-proteobacteria)]
MTEILSGLGGGVWTLVSFLVVLSIIVSVHEYGHYIVGRLCGIRAEVFSLGFGPRLAARTDRRGTVWQIAAIPLGGYVRFLGDDNAASAGPGRAVDPALRRQTLEGAPLWARAATVAAGPVFNFVLAIAVFAGMVMWQGVATDRPAVARVLPAPPGITNELQPGDEILAIAGRPVTDWESVFSRDIPAADSHDWTVNRAGAEITVTGPDPLPPVIGGVIPRNPASYAGLQRGDVVLAIDDQPVQRFTQMNELIARGADSTVTLRLWRAGTVIETELAPKMQDLPAEGGGYVRRPAIGIVLGEGYIEPQIRHPGPAEAVSIGARRTWEVISMSLSGMRAMITGEISHCNLGGAISIAESTGQVAGSGVADFIRWIAVLSVAIGFLNLLPVPVLDGGHLAFYAWEAVTGRAPSVRVMNLLTMIGLGMVISLMLFGLSNDLRC